MKNYIIYNHKCDKFALQFLTQFMLESEKIPISLRVNIGRKVLEPLLMNTIRDSEALRILLDILANTDQLSNPLSRDIRSLRDAVKQLDNDELNELHRIRHILENRRDHLWRQQP